MDPYDAVKIYFVQVKYTNRNESNLIRTVSVAEPAADIAMYAFLINGLFYLQKGEAAEEV